MASVWSLYRWATTAEANSLVKLIVRNISGADAAVALPRRRGVVRTDPAPIERYRILSFLEICVFCLIAAGSNQTLFSRRSDTSFP